MTMTDQRNSLVTVHRLVRQDEDGRTLYMEGIDPTPVFPDDYIEKAALVALGPDIDEMAALNAAWRLTNHVDEDWTTNEWVEAFIPEEFDADGHLTHRSLHGRRSSMVGDLFEFPDGRRFLVARCGFTPFPAREMTAERRDTLNAVLAGDYS